MSLDQFETVMLWIIGGLLFVSALLTLVRITRGPSVLDRVVASDTLISIVLCAIGVQVAFTRFSTTLPLLVSLSLVGFLGAVAVARFVARDRDSDPQPSGPMVDDPEQADSWEGEEPRDAGARSQAEQARSWGERGPRRSPDAPSPRDPGDPSVTGPDPITGTSGPTPRRSEP